MSSLCVRGPGGLTRYVLAAYLVFDQGSLGKEATFSVALDVNSHMEGSKNSQWENLAVVGGQALGWSTMVAASLGLRFKEAQYPEPQLSARSEA